METTVTKTNSSQGTLWVAIGSFLGCLALICLVIQFSNLRVLEALADFATHHYFLAGFIFLIIALSCFKMYSSYHEKISPAYRAKKVNRVARRRTLLANLRKRLSIKNHVAESTFIKSAKITSLQFVTNEVLEKVNDQAARRTALDKARVLGNMYGNKAIICFKDDNSLKHTLATVWQVDDTHVSLLGGATIPLNRIYKVEF